MPINVFVSYSHSDEALYDRLAKHLKPLEREGLIRPWHDRKIIAGSEFDIEIWKELESADIILLLISSDFMASEYCWGVELKRAMERHEAKSARVLPVILRPVDWHRSLFGKLIAAPRDGKAITSWGNEDEAFLDAVRMIRQAVSEMVLEPKRASSHREPAVSASGSKAGAQSEATLKLTRQVGISRGAGIKLTKPPAFNVFIDGGLTGKLDPGETISLNITPGFHYIQVRCLWHRSEKLFMMAISEEIIEIELGILINEQTSVRDRLFMSWAVWPSLFLKRKP